MVVKVEVVATTPVRLLDCGFGRLGLEAVLEVEAREMVVLVQVLVLVLVLVLVVAAALESRSESETFGPRGAVGRGLCMALHMARKVLRDHTSLRRVASQSFNTCTNICTNTRTSQGTPKVSSSIAIVTI